MARVLKHKARHTVKHTPKPKAKATSPKKKRGFNFWDWLDEKPSKKKNKQSGFWAWFDEKPSKSSTVDKKAKVIVKPSKTRTTINVKTTAKAKPKVVTVKNEDIAWQG